MPAAVADAGVPTLINASAVGYYGDTRDRTVDETAPAGAGFLARLCVDWEAATAAAAQAGARVVLARTGLVLAPSGGVLGRLRPLFSLGLGARLGNGRQYMPWISLEDEVRALMFAITHDDLSGPVNLTGPAPVTNAEFTAALGRAVNRPTPMLVPGFALRAALGEFADEGLLVGQRAIPAALERAGFAFHHNTIGEALAYATARRCAATSSVELRWHPSGPARRRRRGPATGHRRLPGRLAAAAGYRRRPGGRRPGHPAAAGASAGVHRRPAHRTARAALDGTPVIDTDRGGKITWHGPGQLVGYPIIGLAEPLDVVNFVRRLEESLITVCAEPRAWTPAGWTAAPGCGCRPRRWRARPARVAAIGIRVARAVTLHGFALNCDCDLGAFGGIVPCGIADAGVTSLTAELGRRVGVDDVRDAVADAVCDALDGRLPIRDAYRLRA